jgi:hypothetical protein
MRIQIRKTGLNMSHSSFDNFNIFPGLWSDGAEIPDGDQRGGGGPDPGGVSLLRVRDQGAGAGRRTRQGTLRQRIQGRRSSHQGSRQGKFFLDTG